MKIKSVKSKSNVTESVLGVETTAPKELKEPKAKKVLRVTRPEKIEGDIKDLVNPNNDVLARVEKTKAKEIHLRYVTYDGEINRLDIRQYNTSDKFTGYTSKGITICRENIHAFRLIIDEIDRLIEEGEIDPLDVSL